MSTEGAKTHEEENVAVDLDNPTIEMSETHTETSEGLTFFQGLGIVIGVQVGSGIFSSPNEVHIHSGSYGASLVIWVVSGLLAWSGAACYCELGSAIPSSGGTSAYLKRIYNEFSGFIYSWMTVLVLKSGGAATISLILGEYIINDPIYKRITAISVLLITLIVNYFGHGAAAGTYFLVLKFSLLLFVFILAVIVGSYRDLSSETVWGGTKSFGGQITAFYGGIWAYDGWDNLNFLAGDMRNPERDLPRVISTAMPLVITAYCIVNCGYFLSMTGDELDAAPSVALTMAAKTHSSVLMMFLRISIALSCAGALNATTMSGIKLFEVTAREGLIPECFSQPLWASVATFLIIAAYICVGRFHTLIIFCGAAGYIFYLAAVIGLLILRYREPDMRRPYRTWLLAPIVFISLSLTIIIRTLFSHPLTFLWLIVFAVPGVLWYFYGVRHQKATA